MDLKALSRSLNKRQGEEISTVGIPPSQDVAFISTGCHALDFILGGGLPRGKTTEIYGAESVGKSTLLMCAMQACHRIGGYTVLLDTEQAAAWERPLIDPELWKKQHLNVTALSVEQGFDIIVQVLDQFIQEHGDGELPPLLIGWDTIAAVDTEDKMVRQQSAYTVTELLGGDSKTKKKKKGKGLTAKPREIHRGFRRITGKVAKAAASLVILNQVSTQFQQWGAYLGSSGGWAMKHYPSLRLYMKKVSPYSEGDEEVGIISSIEVKKSRIARPRTTTVAINYEQGLDNLQTSFQYLVESGAIKKKASWYSIERGPIQGESRQGEQAIRDLILESMSSEVESWIQEETKSHLA